MKNLNRSIRLFASLAAAVSATPFANAQDIVVKVDHETVHFRDQQPIMRGDRVMIPLRGTLQKLGVTVRWDPEKQTVTAFRGNDQVVLKVGDNTANKNGQPFDLHVPALIIHNTTMVPLRFLSQSFGAKVDWHEDSRTVEILTETAD